MSENLLVSLSNITCIYPILILWKKGDIITLWSVIFVALNSIISHLVENHKHGMVGIGFSTDISYILNRMDVLAAHLVGLRYMYLWYKDQIKVKWIWLMLSLLLLFISEYDKYNPNLKNLYIITHCLWHINIFIWLGSVHT